MRGDEAQKKRKVCVCEYSGGGTIGGRGVGGDGLSLIAHRPHPPSISSFAQITCPHIGPPAKAEV